MREQESAREKESEKVHGRARKQERNKKTTYIRVVSFEVLVQHNAAQPQLSLLNCHINIHMCDYGHSPWEEWISKKRLFVPFLDRGDLDP